MKKLLVILITVLSIVALVTPTYALTITVGSGYSKQIGETRVDDAVIIPLGTELYTDGDLNIREQPDANSALVRTVNSPYGICRAFSFFVQSECAFWGKGSDGVDHQWTYVCFTGDCITEYGYVRTDLLVIDADTKIWFEKDKPSSVGEISFRNIPWGTPLSEAKQLLSDICNPDDITVTGHNTNAYTKPSCLDEYDGVYEYISDERYQNNIVYSIVLYDGEIYDNIVAANLSVEGFTRFDGIQVAGIPVSTIILNFVNNDLDDSTEPIFYQGRYFFNTDRPSYYEGYVNAYKNFNDLSVKLETMYTYIDSKYDNNGYTEKECYTYLDSDNNNLTLLYADYGESLGRSVHLTYTCGLFDNYGLEIARTYKSILHSTWDTDGL